LPRLLYWHITPLFSPDNFAGDPENIFANTASFNVLCLPRERGIETTDLKEITAAREAAPSGL